MCGLVGFITTKKIGGEYKRRNWFEQAIAVDSVRGEDSTGVFVVAHGAAVEQRCGYVKSIANGYDFTLLEEYRTAILGKDKNLEKYWAVIGHNRSATKGSVSVKNAHPFIEGPITLVHNGTISTDWRLDVKMEDRKDIQVDSWLIAANFARAEPGAESVLKEINGNFAFIWYDSRDASLRIIRNDQRPLHFLYSPTEDTVFIASEGEMLYWLARRNGIVGDIYSPHPGVLMTWKVGEIVPVLKKVELYDPRTAWVRANERGDVAEGYCGYPTYGGWKPETQLSKNWQKGVVKVAGRLSRTESLLPHMDRMLRDHGVNPEKTYEFDVTTIQPIQGRGSTMIGGIVWLGGNRSMNGSVLLESRECKDTAIKDEWEVKPIGIKQVGDTPVIILKVVAFRPKDEDKEVRTGIKRTMNRLGNREITEWVPGPDAGAYIDMVDWLKFTSNGCCQCGMDINADTAEKVTWTTDSEPVCIECTDDNLKLQAKSLLI